MHNIKTYKLDNNLKVIYLNDPNAAYVKIHLKTKAGSNYENNNNIGAAHLVEHLMINKHKNMLKAYGAKLDAYTKRDTSVVEINILSDYTLTAVEFIVTAVLDNQYSNEMLNTQKKIVQNEIDYYKNNLSNIILQNSYKKMFKNTRMEIDNIGTKKDIDKLTLKSILDFKKNHYFSENMVLCIYGNVDENIIKNINKNFLSFIKSKKQANNIDILNNKNNKFSFNSINKNQKINALKVDFYLGSIENKYKNCIEVLNYILNNELNKSIKDKKANVYQINSQSYFSHNFAILSILSHTNDLKLINEILHKISNLSFYSMFDAKLNMISEKLFESENKSKVLDYYSDQYLLNNPKNLKENINDIKDITISDLKNAYTSVFNQNPVVSFV